MNTKHKIEFAVNCTPKEHEKAWFTVQYRSGILKFWLLVFLSSLFFIGAAAYTLLHKKAEDLFWLATAFCLLSIVLPIVYFTFVILRVNQRRHYYQQKYMAIGERMITVFSHSVSVTSEILSTDIPFSDCQYLVEKKEYYIVIQDRRSYLVIPKRDIPEGKEKEVKRRLKRASATYRIFHKGT